MVVLNTLIAALWLYIQKGLEGSIKNAMQEIYDGYATDGSKHIGVKVRTDGSKHIGKKVRTDGSKHIDKKVGTLLTFGKILYQVLCAAKKKVMHKLVSALLRTTKRVTLKEVDLGTKPPQITEIRCQGGPDECAVEIGVRWESEGAGLKVSADFFGPWDNIQIKNMHLEGTVKLVLKPLRREISGFGAVLVSLKEAPLVDFDLDCGVLFNNNKINRKNIIQEYIKSALMNSIVWPRRFVFPIIPGEDFSFLESWAVGDLKVKLIKAEDIIHTHHVGNVDLFVDLSVHQIQVERSTFKKSSKGPAFWHETFTVQVEDPETQKLTLRLLRRSRLWSRLPDKLIGSGKLPIAQFNPGVEMEMCCDLKNPKTNKECGKLFLAITYHPYP